MIHVSRGTPQHEGPSLCRSCRSATVVTGTRIDEDLVLCSELPRGYDRVTFKVVDCSSYQNKATPTLGAFQQIAWELRTDTAGHEIGFVSPRDARRRKDLAKLPYLDMNGE